MKDKRLEADVELELELVTRQRAGSVDVGHSIVSNIHAAKGWDAERVASLVHECTAKSISIVRVRVCVCMCVCVWRRKWRKKPTASSPCASALARTQHCTDTKHQLQDMIS